ncbi:ribosomal-processing cysteine protease Prp [Loigolactobacillus binensis]|uniref:Ribosomal processing cysteine protease Prp n=1 Tax=Loigolactobacillus binensis TaxID=2559922 RepID=A0ABW3E7N9_9LACO|nr:ribosomal-processing cysteine protease Prp [Loigolactobacillus binensis]
MIQAQFERDQAGVIHYFGLTGHADAGPYGSDIVCAAVSAVAIGAVNGIEQIAAVKPQVTADSVNGGHLECRLPGHLNNEQAKTTQVILATLLLSLESIAADYSDYVTIKK